MTKDELIKRIKTSLRSTTEDEDLKIEIEDLVDEALADLKASTNYPVDMDNPLILRAVKAYAKAHYGYDEQNEKWMAIYKAVKSDLGTFQFSEVVPNAE